MLFYNRKEEDAEEEADADDDAKPGVNESDNILKALLKY